MALNCAGLKAHFQDIKTDGRLQKAHIIHLVETSITEDDDEETLKLDGLTTCTCEDGIRFKVKVTSLFDTSCSKLLILGENVVIFL